MPALTGHFLDDERYDWSKPESQEFYDTMLGGYPKASSAQRLLAISGIDNDSIDFAQPPRDFWMQALEVAARSRRTRKLAQSARADRLVAAYHARLDRLMGVSPALPEAPSPGKDPVVWRGEEVVTGTQETFLDVAFLHHGLRAAESVVRLTTVTEEEKSFHGTGFLIAPDTFLTNHHVLHDRNGRPVKRVDIWFDYEIGPEGQLRRVGRYEGDVATIVGDAAHDWAILRSKEPLGRPCRPLSLVPSKPVTKGDFVYIVQHPEGRPKKIGLLHNEVVDVSADRVQYLTDTLRGSSGSPVCNELWEVVALHYRGIEGDPVKGTVCKNEGILIDRVVDGLTAVGILKPSAGR
ncbi:trypsin-like peptidase domain-containing protein [Sorangium sp. So ce204]|uniref:trypsin-like peptidase domain-containing protein n=1 Tax=Sorangium sp. So ce204 TaxID=3133288 RepID=UPI003F5F071F